MFPTNLAVGGVSLPTIDATSPLRRQPTGATRTSDLIVEDFDDDYDVDDKMELSSTIEGSNITN